MHGNSSTFARSQHPSGRGREGGRRLRCLHREAELAFTAIQLLLRDNSRLQFTSESLSRGRRHNFTPFLKHSDVRDARLNFCRLFAELHGEQSAGGNTKVFVSATAEQVTMSRKKAVKGKVSSRSPKGSPSSGKDGGRTGKGLAAAAAPSSGLVYPSRPSLSNSGEFYDIAFKVSREILSNQSINQPINQSMRPCN